MKMISGSSAGEGERSNANYQVPQEIPSDSFVDVQVITLTEATLDRSGPGYGTRL